MVVPNGPLFADGVAARIKQELLKEFNLHTIVRLPNGVFAPYTAIPTNLLFFQRDGPTQDVWYYELPLPAGRRVHQDEADAVRGIPRLAGLVERTGEENEHAWRVPVKDDSSTRGGNLVSANLDVKNPNSSDPFGAHATGATCRGHTRQGTTDHRSTAGDIFDLGG